nr:hypothetical protein orf148 [Navicula sp.]
MIRAKNLNYSPGKEELTSPTLSPSNQPSHSPALTVARAEYSKFDTFVKKYEKLGFKFYDTDKIPPEKLISIFVNPARKDGKPDVGTIRGALTVLEGWKNDVHPEPYSLPHSLAIRVDLDYQLAPKPGFPFTFLDLKDPVSSNMMGLQN